MTKAAIPSTATQEAIQIKPALTADIEAASRMTAGDES
jgi:hypothetical protein